jgi:choline dehydrogenase
LAQRILFDGRRAAAIEYRQAGRLRNARARKEILVSSGAYNSPQLLQLSGVGPADLLQKHGIDIVLAAPGVGHDLQDHMQVRVVTRCPQSITLNDIVNHPVRRILAGARYAAFRTGPLFPHFRRQFVNCGRKAAVRFASKAPTQWRLLKYASTISPPRPTAPQMLKV